MQHWKKFDIVEQESNIVWMMMKKILVSVEEKLAMTPNERARDVFLTLTRARRVCDWALPAKMHIINFLDNAFNRGRGTGVERPNRPHTFSRRWNIQQRVIK
jgi:hypothetical protein